MSISLALETSWLYFRRVISSLLRVHQSQAKWHIPDPGSQRLIQRSATGTSENGGLMSAALHQTETQYREEGLMAAPLHFQ